MRRAALAEVVVDDTGSGVGVVNGATLTGWPCCQRHRCWLIKISLAAKVGYFGDVQMSLKILLTVKNCLRGWPPRTVRETKSPRIVVGREIGHNRVDRLALIIYFFFVGGGVRISPPVSARRGEAIDLIKRASMSIDWTH